MRSPKRVTLKGCGYKLHKEKNGVASVFFGKKSPALLGGSKTGLKDLLADTRPPKEGERRAGGRRESI